MALKDLEELSSKEKGFDEYSVRKKELVHYLKEGDIFRSGENGDTSEFRVLSVGPKKKFAYGVFENGEGKYEGRISVDRIAREYEEVARFRKIVPIELR